MVLYFSGTGNSRYIANRISKALQEPLYSINDGIKNSKPGSIETGENVILVIPTYAWRIPRIVNEWLLSTTLIGAEKIWFIMNCGGEIGNASKYNKKISDKKHLQYMGTAEIVMPENYIAMFTTPAKEEAKSIIEKAEPIIDDIIEMVKTQNALKIPRNNLYDRFMSSAVNPAFYSFCVKSSSFVVKENCIGCGKCVKLCPLNNISLKDNKPVWGKNCTHCMACISYCPNEAIEYGKHSSGLERYYFEKINSTMSSFGL